MNSDMAKRPTTVRLDDQLHKKVQREAKKMGMTMSGVIHHLLVAFASGEVEIGVTQYPKGYLEQLEKEADELRELRRQGKVKGYRSAKELFDDMLGR